mmetsp:Transcript_12251/g.20619  ORF Transcript_12251/g.20619 Transcript_12251/m.20619 type:complete len:143 (-) Transcript_12251:53-481(-)
MERDQKLIDEFNKQIQFICAFQAVRASHLLYAMDRDAPEKRLRDKMVVANVMECMEQFKNKGEDLELLEKFYGDFGGRAYKMEANQYFYDDMKAVYGYIDSITKNVDDFWKSDQVHQLRESEQAIRDQVLFKLDQHDFCFAK